MTSRGPFLLLRISFPGRPFLYNWLQVFFDSLYSLITHYQQNPLVSPKFSITLGRAVPPPNQGWFFKTFFVSFHTTFLPNEGGR